MRRRRRSERGSALVEVVWLGILLLVPLLWVVLSVFEVQRGAFAVTSAARSAARAYALVRERVPFTAAGETVPADLEPVVELLRSELLRLT